METIASEEALEGQLLKVFNAFDKQNTQRVKLAELPCLLGGLDIYPSLIELEGVASQIKASAKGAIDADHDDCQVTFQAVRECVLPLMAKKAMPRAAETDLNRAFQALDPECKMYLTKAQLVDFLCKQGGEPLSEAQIDELFSFAANRKDGNLYYEDYIKLLLA